MKTEHASARWQWIGTEWRGALDAPEADLTTVAEGDFSRLSMPLLVAAASKKQLEDFVFRNGLMCTEVRRFQAVGSICANLPAGKILLLLPQYHLDPATEEAVEWWVDGEDRYTVELPGPLPALSAKSRFWRMALVVLLVLWGMFGWLLIR